MANIYFTGFSFTEARMPRMVFQMAAAGFCGEALTNKY
jgi:hypothetical protein